MAVKFQLIFNGNLEQAGELVDLMPAIADILEIDVQFVGSYFTGRSVILTDSEQFKPIQIKQRQLENIGIYCDIKPVTEEGDTIIPDQQSSIQLSKDIQYKSTFKTPDTDQHDLIELNINNNKSTKKSLNPIDMKFDDTLYTKKAPKDEKVSNTTNEDFDDTGGFDFDFDDQWKR